MARSDSDIAKICKKHRNISKRGLTDQYNNTEACRSFYNGDSMTYTDRIQFEDDAGRRRRAMVNFNKVQAPVDAVVGFMAQNRRQAKFIARQNADEKQSLYSKNMNALYTFHRERTNADQVETEQDADMMINGYGAVETDLSYIIGNATTDPNGEILKMNIDALCVGWDPKSKSKNMGNGRWAYYFEDFELGDALDLFQDSQETDFQKVSDDGNDDTGYVYNPWGGLYDKIKANDSVEWTNKEQNMVRVYNHQWFEYETVYKAENPLYSVDNVEDALFVKGRLDIIASQIKDDLSYDDLKTQDAFDFDATAETLFMDEKTNKAMVKEFGTLIDPVSFIRKCYYTAVYSGDHVFKWFKSVSQAGFSIKFKTGIYNSQGEYWTGMVSAMMEPTKYSNKALTELMFTIAANSKGGVMVEEDAVEDISDFETKWAKTDAVIRVNSGALGAGKIQQKTQGAVPTGLESILSLADASITANGVDPSFLGQMDPDAQTSGILYKRRIRQVVSKMARYFDSITLYQKEDARLCADLIRVWIQNNNGVWTRITGENGKDAFVQITEDMLAPDYDVSIQEAPTSTDDKQETAAILSGYGDKLALINPQGAQAFYSESLQMLSLDGDVQNRLIQALQPAQMVPAQQYQQVVQELQKLQGQVSQIQLAKLQSETDLNKAKTQQTHTTSAKTLEEATRANLENSLIKSGNFTTPTVTI